MGFNLYDKVDLTYKVLFLHFIFFNGIILLLSSVNLNYITKLKLLLLIIFLKLQKFEMIIFQNLEAKNFFYQFF